MSVSAWIFEGKAESSTISYEKLSNNSERTSNVSTIGKNITFSNPKAHLKIFASHLNSLLDFDSTIYSILFLLFLLLL